MKFDRIALFGATILVTLGPRPGGAQERPTGHAWMPDARDEAVRVYDRKPPLSGSQMAAVSEQPPFEPAIARGEVRLGPGGSRYRGSRSGRASTPTPKPQPDARLRELNGEPATSRSWKRSGRPACG